VRARRRRKSNNSSKALVLFRNSMSAKNVGCLSSDTSSRDQTWEAVELLLLEASLRYLRSSVRQARSYQQTSCHSEHVYPIHAFPFPLSFSFSQKAVKIDRLLETTRDARTTMATTTHRSRSVSSSSLPPRRPSPLIELSPADKEKEALISAACGDGDLDSLVLLSTGTSGLLTDSLRRTAWPLLLGCSEQATTPWEKLPPHKDEHQVGLDVNRAFCYYPNGTQFRLPLLYSLLREYRVREAARSPERRALRRDPRRPATSPSTVLLPGLP